MAIELGALFWRVAISGAADAQDDLRRLRGEARATDQSLTRTEGAVRDLGTSFGGIAQSAMAAGAGMAAFAAGAAAASGVGIAARFQRLEVGFATLLGSAQRARGMIEELRKLGAQTDFNTEDLVGFSRTLLATGVAAERLLPTLRAITDTTAALGGNSESVGGIALALRQIRQSPRLQGDELNQLVERGVPIQRIMEAATGRTYRDTGEATRALKAMSGQQAFDTIILGMQKAFGGAAARNAGTVLGVVQNLGETLQNIMLPTGRLLLPVVGGVGFGLLKLAQAAQKLNELTGGGAGLVAGFMLLYKAKGFLIGAAIRAVGALGALNAELTQLAATGWRAAGSVGGGAAAGAAGAVGGSAMRMPAYGGMRNAWKTAGVRGALRVGAGALRAVRIATILPFLADLGLNAVGGMIGGGWGNALKSAGTGAGMGAMAGSFIPGLGTGAGAIAGGALGLGKGIWDMMRGGDARAAERTAKATEQIAKTLQDVKGTLVGGGPRLGGAVAQTEVEIALARMYGTGIA